nr:mitoferrin-1 isoform X2 [Taeniopygia guttata]XP_041576538.1 mitoferrin-1 isoform X2 [Taeniopygia guttata]
MQSLQPDPKAQYRSVYEALKKMVLTEGFWRPLRGINVTMLGAGPAHALYFACYEKMKKSLSDIFQPGGNSHLANGIAGSAATLLHDAVMNPAEGHPLHHLRAGAGAPEPPPPLPPPVPHRGRRPGRGRGRRRHHAAGRVQDAAQHAGEHGPELPQDQGAPVGHGQRLQHRLPAGRGARLLQGRPSSGHLPDALHGHRLVRVRVLQVLPHQAGAGEEILLVREEQEPPWACSQPARLELCGIHGSKSPCLCFPGRSVTECPQGFLVTECPCHRVSPGLPGQSPSVPRASWSPSVPRGSWSPSVLRGSLSLSVLVTECPPGVPVVLGHCPWGFLVIQCPCH